jgi:hypothetical protein
MRRQVRWRIAKLWFAGGGGRRRNEMKMSSNNSRNSSLVSIREPHLKRCKPDMRKDEKGQTPILNLEALNVIGRLVRTIKERIDVSQRSETGSDREVGEDTRSSAPASPDRSQNHDREEEENR